MFFHQIIVFSSKSTIRSLELTIHPISVVSSHLKSYHISSQANPGGDAAVQHDWALVPASLQDDVWNPGKDHRRPGITNAYFPFGINEFLQIGWVVGVRGRHMFVLFRI